MNILSIFTLKKDAKLAFSKDSIVSLLKLAQEEIIKMVDKKNLLGSEKKAKVDEVIIDFINNHWVGINSALDWLIKYILIPAIPSITQFIYDALVKNVKGLTEAKS